MCPPTGTQGDIRVGPLLIGFKEQLQIGRLSRLLKCNFHNPSPWDVLASLAQCMITNQIYNNGWYLFIMKQYLQVNCKQLSIYYKTNYPKNQGLFLGSWHLLIKRYSIRVCLVKYSVKVYNKTFLDNLIVNPESNIINYIFILLSNILKMSFICMTALSPTSSVPTR